MYVNMKIGKVQFLLLYKPDGGDSFNYFILNYFNTSLHFSSKSNARHVTCLPRSQKGFLAFFLVMQSDEKKRKSDFFRKSGS